MDIISSLCNIFYTSEDELGKTMEKANNIIADILKKTPFPASECNSENMESIDTGYWKFPYRYIIRVLIIKYGISFIYWCSWNFNTHVNGLTYFEDLLEDSSLSSSLGILEKDYDDAIRREGELDERVFVNDEDSILVSGSLSGGAVNISGVKVCFQWTIYIVFEVDFVEILVIVSFV